MRYGWITCCCIVLLLLALFSGTASSRRAGRRGSPPQGDAHSTLKSGSKQSQSGGGQSGAKMAGLAAVGAAMGYGLNSLGKSHCGRRGQSSPVGGREKGFNSSGVMVKGPLHGQALKGPGLPAFSLLVCGLTASLFQN